MMKLYLNFSYSPSLSSKLTNILYRYVGPCISCLLYMWISFGKMFVQYFVVFTALLFGLAVFPLGFSYRILIEVNVIDCELLREEKRCNIETFGFSVNYGFVSLPTGCMPKGILRILCITSRNIANFLISIN